MLKSIIMPFFRRTVGFDTWCLDKLAAQPDAAPALILGALTPKIAAEGYSVYWEWQAGNTSLTIARGDSLAGDQRGMDAGGC